MPKTSPGVTSGDDGLKDLVAFLKAQGVYKFERGDVKVEFFMPNMQVSGVVPDLDPDGTDPAMNEQLDRIRAKEAIRRARRANEENEDILYHST
jgi:hypothetical protein